ncbi:MAG TPA: helix-turn-helix domain-containing protein [Flavisolibacter sp.]|nr:helix-turn-helix domain-containing protein [Flavisolibacter sp.]
MSSNIRITRVCQFCGKEFEARTTVTKTCSDYCAKRLYKQRQKAVKIESSNAETLAIRQRPIDELKAKEFLTVKDAAKLLNCSTRTAYHLIAKGSLKAVNISQRKTLIKRSDIDELFA